MNEPPMNDWQDRSWPQRMDSLLINSPAARFLRARAALRRQAAPPAGGYGVWPRATITGVAVLAALMAVAVPAWIVPAMQVLVVLVIATPLLGPWRVFWPLPDERDLAVQHAGNGAGYAATALIAMTGLLVLTAQALLDMRNPHQLGYEAGLFVLLGCIAITHIGPLYKATCYSRGDQ